MIELRDFQKAAVAAVSQNFESGHYSQLISLPTGSGKTIVMAAIAKHFNKRMLLLAHREELIYQAYDKFKLFWPEADIGICKGEREEVKNQIIIGSVQSCYRPKRLEKLKEVGFDILMVDECHHAHNESSSYQKIIDGLGFRNDPSKLLLGVTATPGRSLNVFGKLVYKHTIGDMIEENYLTPITGRKIHTNFSIDGVRVHGGDFAVEQLSRAINTPSRNGFIVEKFKEHASKRKAIVFCCDVKHCIDIANTFKRAGISSKAFYGSMPSEDRSLYLQDLKMGEIQVATSCGILVEGFDETSIDCIVLARPTRSEILFVQALGRGLRIHPNKENCLLLDFVDSGHDLEKIVSLADVIPSFKESRESEASSKDRSPKIGINDECDEEFELLGAEPRYLWISLEDELVFLDDQNNQIVINPQEGGYVAHFYKGLEKTVVVNEPLPQDYCIGSCEDFIRKNKLKVQYSKQTSEIYSSDLPPSDQQMNYLSKEGVFPKEMTRGEAAIKIRELICLKARKKRISQDEPLSERQAYFLKNHGVNIEGMTKREGILAISELKKDF